LLVKENKKFVKLKNAYALEVEKCENLTKELSICNDSISCLRDENASLNTKIEELNVCKPSTSTVSMSLFALDVDMLILKLLMINLP
jgi:DNA polymerase III sliding clamp (beta) subunit (PCNA family)